MKISEFLSENFQFLVVKFSIYLNRRVFVMFTSFQRSPFPECETEHFDRVAFPERASV